MSRPSLIGIACLASLLAACSGAGSPGLLAEPDPKAPTYWKDVAPIVQAKCESCHRAGGIGPFTFESYAEVQAYAPLIAEKVKDRSMPPWPPGKGCNEFQNDRSLTDAEIATIASWADHGAWEGKPADASQPAGTATDKLVDMGQPSYTVDPGFAYTSVTKELDDYHCFVVDPKLDAPRDVIGVGVRPGNARIVHHVIAYEVEAGDLTKLDGLDAKEPGPGYTCFGGPGVNAQWIAAWAPGGMPGFYPKDTGIRLKKGSKIVMQVHYNLANVRGESDQSKVDLWFSPQPVAHVAYMAPLPQMLLNIPAGQNDVEVGMQYTVGSYGESSITLYGAAAHMHLLGKRFNLTLKPGGGATSNACMLDVPRYDFHWQGMFMFKEPVVAKKNDVVEMTCVYDNTAANQPVVDGQKVTPRDVHWGESTFDEMCLALLYITYN